MPIIMRHLPRTRHRIAQLPKQIRRQPRIFQPQRGALPLTLHGTVVRLNIHPILLEQTRLARFLARGRVGANPRIAPIIRGAPGLGVQVEGAEGDVGEGEVGGEVEALAELVGVGAVAGEAEALVANGDHVVAVERADVVGALANPVCEDGGRAAVAARFVGEFPREHGGRGAVARHDGFDVGLVHGLAFGGGVPLGVAADAAGGEVGCHAAVVGPVVDKVDDELDVVFLRGADDGVQALQAVGARVDGCGAAGERLEVDGAGAWDGCYVIETPDAEDLLAGGCEVAHDGVDIVVVGHEGYPVAVGAGVVWKESVGVGEFTLEDVHLVTPSMLNLRPSTFEYDARAAMLFVAAGSAAAAAAKERIVASFIVAASWLAGQAGPVLAPARLYECSTGGAYRSEAEKVRRRHLSVSKQISP